MVVDVRLPTEEDEEEEKDEGKDDGLYFCVTRQTIPVPVGERGMDGDDAEPAEEDAHEDEQWVAPGPEGGGGCRVGRAEGDSLGGRGVEGTAGVRPQCVSETETVSLAKDRRRRERARARTHLFPVGTPIYPPNR